MCYEKKKKKKQCSFVIFSHVEREYRLTVCTLFNEYKVKMHSSMTIATLFNFFGRNANYHSIIY